MRERKYTLPRHTNLANQGPRIGAFLIDLSLTLAFTLGLLFGVFKWVFNFKTKPLAASLYEQRLASHLFFEKDGALDWYSTGDDNNEFINALKDFYTLYIPEEDVGKDEPLKLSDGSTVNRKDYFTVRWFNENVLAVEGDGRGYFEYQKVGEEDNKEVLALIKSDADEGSVNSFLQKAWVNANYQLNRLPSFLKINNEYGFYNTLEFVLSTLIAATFVYIIVPIIFKDGVTVGKKAFGLSLANIDGYKFNNNLQLLLRLVPTYVVILALLLPIWKSLITVVIVAVVLLLASFTFVMASPKKCALHDFTARTIVVDAKSSILFELPADEEKYIAKEDGLLNEEQSE